MLAALSVDSLTQLELTPTAPMDAQTREQLKALGYID
jgi:hypothetical protein